jgi:hypothetical protein
MYCGGLLLSGILGKLLHDKIGEPWVLGDGSGGGERAIAKGQGQAEGRAG